MDMKNTNHLSVNTTLCNRYIVGLALGSNKLGITYMGYDNAMNKKIAIKEYFPEELATRNENAVSGADSYASGLQQFIQEGNILKAKKGLPGIVEVLDVIEENGTAYIIMEYIEGTSLEEIVKSGRLFPVKRMQDLLDPILKSLFELHEAGVIHQNISPDNFIFTNDGILKLIGFGCLQGVVSDKSRGYAPVELYSRQNEKKPSIDIYAICATIYRCITGKVPMDATQRTEKDELQTPSSMGIEISEVQEAVIMMGLSVKVAKRLQGIQALYRALYGTVISGGATPKAGSSQVVIKLEEPVKGEDPEVKMESVKAEEPEVKMEPVKGEDPEVEMEPVKGEDPEVEMEPVKGEDPEVEMEPVKGEEPEVKMEPVKGEDPEVEMEPVKGEDPEVEMEPVKGEDPEVEMEPVKAEEPKVKAESVKPKEPRRKYKKKKGANKGLIIGICVALLLLVIGIGAIFAVSTLFSGKISTKVQVTEVEENAESVESVVEQSVTAVEADKLQEIKDTLAAQDYVDAIDMVIALSDEEKASYDEAEISAVLEEAVEGVKSELIKEIDEYVKNASYDEAFTVISDGILYFAMIAENEELADLSDTQFLSDKGTEVKQKHKDYLITTAESCANKADEAGMEEALVDLSSYLDTDEMETKRTKCYGKLVIAKMNQMRNNGASTEEILTYIDENLARTGNNGWVLEFWDYYHTVYAMESGQGISMDTTIKHASDEGYLLENSNTINLTTDDISHLSQYELYLALYEIYARHGRGFNDASVTSYFSQYSWYQETTRPEVFDESLLNEYEKYNRDLIIEYQYTMGYR